MKTRPTSAVAGFLILLVGCTAVAQPRSENQIPRTVFVKEDYFKWTKELSNWGALGTGRRARHAESHHGRKNAAGGRTGQSGRLGLACRVAGAQYGRFWAVCTPANRT